MEENVNLLNLKPELVEQILKTLEPSKDKEWLELQFKEQQIGGAWKARLREQGYVI